MVPRVPAPQAVPRARNGYLDLLGGGSIVAVVVGHWLATGVLHPDGLA